MSDTPPLNKHTILQTYLRHFTSQPEVLVRAPGRINLIGEHTDYNMGFVLPAAIDKAVWFAAERREDDALCFYAADLKEEFVSETGETVFQSEKQWANYLLGVIHETRKTGLNVGGMNLAFGSDIPIGAGLSSSAALECGALAVINTLFSLRLSAMDMVNLAQRGENVFVGMNCGIMDMFASVFGRNNQVIRLDCESLDYAYFPFETPDYVLVLCDSGIRHALVESEYNTRRAECEEGCRLLRRFDPAIRSLRDVSTDFFLKHASELPPVVQRRCAYVLEENNRVVKACTALQQGDWQTLGRLLLETHEGLSRDYEVSCPEIDFLVAQAKLFPGLLGARLMGGGFGGCTLNLVEKEAVEKFSFEMKTAYQTAYGRELKIYPVQLADGVAVWEDF